VTAPSPQRGEGWGEGERALARASAITMCAGHPHPTLSLEGEGLSACVEKRRSDFHQDPIEIVEDIVVPEAEHGVTIGLDNTRPLGIAGAFRMLPTIQFDHQPRAATAEIRHVRADRVLANEFGSLQLSASQTRPQPRLHVRRASAQTSRILDLPFRRHSRRSPSPNPLPAGRGPSGLA